MKSVSRRGFCAALPAAAVMSGVAGEGQTAAENFFRDPSQRQYLNAFGKPLDTTQSVPVH